MRNTKTPQGENTQNKKQKNTKQTRYWALPTHSSQDLLFVVLFFCFVRGSLDSANERPFGHCVALEMRCPLRLLKHMHMSPPRQPPLTALVSAKEPPSRHAFRPKDQTRP